MLNILISMACSILSLALINRYATDNMWIGMLVSILVFFVVFILKLR